MTGEKSAERRLFSILFEICSGKAGNPFVDLLVLVGYLLVLLLCYFVLVDSSDIISTTLAASTSLSLAVLVATGVVLA
jgi:hypothetical protein